MEGRYLKGSATSAPKYLTSTYGSDSNNHLTTSNGLLLLYLRYLTRSLNFRQSTVNANQLQFASYVGTAKVHSKRRTYFIARESPTAAGTVATVVAAAANEVFVINRSNLYVPRIAFELFERHLNSIEL